MTAQTKKSKWDTKKLATSRSKREATSAPRQGDLKIYERFFKQVIKNKKNPRVLVLGATPELRDLCLKHKCETIAVDVSWHILVSMHEVMKYKDDLKNKVVLYDWLGMDKIFKNNTFDAVLADASLNNLRAKDHLQMFKVLSRLLKPNGGFITRNAILQKELSKKSIDFFQKAYEKGDLNWLELYIAFLIVWHKETLVSPNQRSAEKLNKRFIPLLNKKLLVYRQQDQWKINNVLFHGSTIIHTEFRKKRFEQMAKKYFKIAGEDYRTKNKEIRFLPIYYFKNKK